ncbi:MAG: orotate phosphoribosyltransferase [Bacteroidetes bacterium HGW-Bacteroidetes-12]|nr:MAG: orotate phosphoribosyltransferase [Bacteroidetes bacterium HGW-Bacteroidetes-12]
MIFNKESAHKIAELLLQIKAIKLQSANPFIWASGWKSPIYCDNRKALSYPPVRTYIRQQFVDAIKEHYPTAEIVVGVATGGIAHGALVAEALGLPFAYVRSAAKGHGLENLIEGDLKPGQQVVVIEDLVSTGGSSLKAVEELRESGCNVLGMLAIFSYGFDTAIQNFKTSKCKLITLSDYNTLIDAALNTKFISEKEVDSLNKWRKNPSEWKP